MDDRFTLKLKQVNRSVNLCGETVGMLIAKAGSKASDRRQGVSGVLQQDKYYQYIGAASMQSLGSKL